MEIILASIIAFASTNIDDIFILTLFLSDRRYKTSDIYFGQYLGIIALIAISLTGSLLGNFIDSKYVGLLGLFPIYLGLRQIVSLIRNKNKEQVAPEMKNSKSAMLNVATVTFANGGDNIGVYIPLFAALTAADKSVMIGIFLLMVWIWLTLAKYVTKHPISKNILSKYGHIITPFVLCLLGLYILKENDSFQLVK
jgi:cadmium resistance protein CadD (predicted permease)